MKATDLNHPAALLGAGLLGAYLGASFVDIDLSIPLLRHRSIITHGFLLTGVLWWAAFVWKPSIHALRLAMTGFGSGVAAHLCFDLWPRGWSGTALISVPMIGRLPAALSFLWIAGSIVVCLALAGWVIQTVVDILAGAAGIGIAVYAHYGHESMILPVITLAASLAIIHYLPGPTLVNKVKAYFDPDPVVSKSTSDDQEPPSQETTI